MEQNPHNKVYQLSVIDYVNNVLQSLPLSISEIFSSHQKESLYLLTGPSPSSSHLIPGNC